MMKCPQCGQEQEGTGACSQCGTEVVQTESAQGGMTACPKCNASLQQGALFCAMCGTKIEENKAVEIEPLQDLKEAIDESVSQQPAQQPEQTATSQQVGYPYPVSVEQEPAAAPAPQPEEPQKGGSKKTLAVAICLAVVFFVCVGVFVLSQVDDKVNLPVIGGGASETSGSKSTKNQDADMPFVYLQDKEVIKFRTPGMERSQIITDKFSMKADYYSEWLFSDYLTWMSEDGSYLLYLNNFRQTSYYSYEGRGDLYIRDLTTLTDQGETDIGIKIASDVSSDFYISDNNCYVFYITNKNDLYVWDFSETYKLDSNVTGIYSWTDDMVFYYKGDVDDYYTSYFSSRDFYVAPLTKDGRDAREKVDTDISDMLDWNDDLTQFMYTKKNSDRGSDNVTFDLYRQDLSNGKRETVVSGVAEVVEADLETGLVVFLKEQEATVFYEDIIEDDMLEQDAVLVEPQMEDYPLLYWYYNDYDYYSDDEIDYDLLEEQFEAYEEAQALYAGKERREQIRKLLDSEFDDTRTVDLYLYELYYMKDGDTSKIDNDVYLSSSYYDTDISVDLEHEFVAYAKADLKDLPKLKLSEMQGSYSLYSFDLEDYISSNLTGEMYFAILGSSPKLIVSKDDALKPSTWYVTMNEAGTGVYFRATDLSGESEDDDSDSRSSNSSDWWDDEDYWSDYWDYDWYNEYSSYSSYSSYQTPVYNLYYVPVDGNSFGSVTLVEEDISYLSLSKSYMGKTIYITNGKNNQGDLYALDGMEKERLAYDISSYSFYSSNIQDDGAVILFYEDYDDNRDMGELCMIIGDDEKVRIADSVYEYYYYSNDMIYLLRNYRSGKGDLYLYDGENVTLIDYDVTGVVEFWYGY